MKLNLRKEVFKAEWRPIKGYEGLYAVSNLGQIRSLDRYIKEKSGKVRFAKGILLKTTRKENKYLVVNLCKNRKQKIFNVHRLVAETFIPNTENKPHIDHIDTNKSNNRVWNLRWVTAKENNNNPLTLKKFKNKVFSKETKKKMSKAHKGKTLSEETKKKLSEIKKGENNPFYGKHHSEESKKKMSESNKNKRKVLCIETNIIYNSITECSKAMNIKRCSISEVCRGKRKSAKRYHFKFVD